MRAMAPVWVALIAGLTAWGAPASAQAVAQADTVPARVYLDCQGQAGFGCDQNFVRTEVVFVDWVTDRADADVHVLVTAQQSGGGGRQFTLAFIGLRRFDGDQVELVHASSGDDTQDAVRRAITDQIKLGLVRYAALTPARSRLRVTYTAPTQGTGAASQAANDPWNFWVFNLRVNGFANGESSSSSLNLNGSINAARVTEAWKVSLGGNFNRNRQRYTLSDREVIAIREGWGANGLIVKTLTPKWSAGIRTNLGSQSTQNQDLFAVVTPGIEFNFFPYSESTRRSLTVQYLVGASHFQWADTTIFGEISETRPNHSLTTEIRLNQPWGQVSLELSGSQYLHDLQKYNLRVGGNMQWRVFRGFSLNLGGNYTRVRDQLFLPKGELTDDEVLTQQRQLQTGYRYFTNFGISYRFGSIFNNVVNPRFGPDGGGGGPF
jgi:hypothetical protein